ncbi:MAG: hypothetical protein AAFN91_10245 [Pseudomonadota bacterium]
MKQTSTASVPTSQLDWLARAQAMQTIEGNPFTAAEIAELEGWEAEGLTTDQMRERVLQRIRARQVAPAAE